MAKNRAKRGKRRTRGIASDGKNGRREWQLQEAKARFSELVERARTSGPQWVSRHGKPAVAIVAAEEFEKLVGMGQERQPEKLSDFFSQSPLAEVDLDLEREPAEDRPVDL